MLTIDSMLREACRTHSDQAALRYKVAGVWRDVTYGELWSLSDRIAAGLIKCGFQPGDHAALLAPSCPNWVATYLGILKAGGVVVPIDKELKSAELRHVLADCDARMIFTDPQYLDLVLEVLADIPQMERCVLISGTLRTDADRNLSRTLETLLAEWRSLIADLTVPAERVVRLETLASQAHRMLAAPAASRSDQKEVVNPFAPIEAIRAKLTNEGLLQSFDEFCHDAPLPERLRTAQDTAVILYTSGTTGRSKGAMLSHANIVSNIQAAVSHFGLTKAISTLSFLPINHVFEQVCGVLLPLSLGGTVTFCESLKKLGENLAEVKPTFFLAVPAVYRVLLDRIMKNVGAKRLSQLLFSFALTRPLVTSKVRQAFGSGTIFVSGGAALDPAIVDGMTRLGLLIYQGYGITETSPIISAEQPGVRQSGSVGRVLDGVQVRIDTPNEDGIGEIVVHGHNVMQGYYKNPAATIEVLTDGWYRTGDLGYLDSKGILTICGRVKNLIVTPNGKNVYPEEVEGELLKSPFITEVMVYGHTVGPAAEEVHAVIYPCHEALDEYCSSAGKGALTDADVERLLRAEVLAACNSLADYKRVRKFTIRGDEFPKTTTRKIKRYAVEASIST
jgi:long-chain acyl-CoA synthetase